MSERPKPRLCVFTEGKRHYISVPAGDATALHGYLRSNRVRSSPPEPALTGFDSIELSAGIDVASVQHLLDAWV